jgi:hypothetical protein
MVKIFERIESTPVMMDTRHEEYPLGAAVGIRYRNSEPKTVASEEYLITENRILRAHLPARRKLTDDQHGGQGASNIRAASPTENIVALCDVDP